MNEIRCWDMEAQKNIDYQPWMKYCPYIAIFVDEVTWKNSHEKPL